MKKIIYAIALLLATTSISANTDPSLWDATNGEKAAKFDNWIDIVKDGEVVNIRPFGWFAPAPYNTSTIMLQPTTDRNGVENGACKATVIGFTPTETWFSWHNQMKNQYNASEEDYNPIFIPQGDAFYYTFWAKADEDGLNMYVGPEELWDPKYNDNKPTWPNFPSVQLTTNWKKYGHVVSARQAFMELSTFNVQFRRNGVWYFDDFELRSGDELPADVGTELGIFDMATDENPFIARATSGGVLITSASVGTVSVYNAVGSLVAQKAINSELEFVSIAANGLCVVKFTSENNKITTQKVVLK